MKFDTTVSSACITLRVIVKQYPPCSHQSVIVNRVLRSLLLLTALCEVSVNGKRYNETLCFSRYKHTYWHLTLPLNFLTSRIKLKCCVKDLAQSIVKFGKTELFNNADVELKKIYYVKNINNMLVFIGNNTNFNEQQWIYSAVAVTFETPFLQVWKVKTKQNFKDTQKNFLTTVTFYRGFISISDWHRNKQLF